MFRSPWEESHFAAEMNDLSNSLKFAGFPYKNQAFVRL